MEQVRIKKTKINTREDKLLAGLKVAIVHDYLVEYGGAERILECFASIFPDAPIYTIVYDPKLARKIVPGHTIRSSFLQKVPFTRSGHRFFPLLMPMAVESFDFSYYDLVISDSASFAKGVITPADTLHICYCHTPTRYVWDDCHKYIRESSSYLGFMRRFIPAGLNYVRLWDRMAADRVDLYLANSKLVSERIKKYYQRDSKVINPPVFTHEFIPPQKKSANKYYLMIGRLMPYKKFDLGIKAFNKLGLPLKIIGGGPEISKLRKIAKSNIEIIGPLPPRDKRVAKYLANSKAFIFPQEEDFGIVQLEAMISGKPVIAYRAGGALETIIEDVTGVFFRKQTVNSLVRAVKRFEKKYNENKFDPVKIYNHANSFRREVFEEKIKKYILRNYKFESYSAK